jgi:hypothetical protein
LPTKPMAMATERISLPAPMAMPMMLL